MSEQSKSQHDFIDSKVLSRLSRLALHSRIPMIGSVAGRHRSPIRGSSLEFAEYRKYVPGDDTRRLDWRVWGRSDRFYIKEFEADTNLRLCLIIDTSGSMGYEVDGISKIDQAKSLGGSLGYLASRQGDAVGVYCSGKDFHTEIQPKRNATHLRVVLDTISEIKPAGETGLADSLHEAAERIRQRALVVVISDLFIEPSILQNCFQHLQFRKHDVAVFHMLDRTEVDFDIERPTRFNDMEGGESIMADPSLMRKQYRKAIGSYISALKTVMRNSGVDYHRVNLNQSIDSILSRFLIGRTPKKKK